jgi:hemerythrin
LVATNMSSYKLGNELLDKEHEMFFFLTNYLKMAALSGKTHQVQINIAHEIQKYVQFHFFSEENYMEEIGFPNLQEHCALHTILLTDLGERIYKLVSNQLNCKELVLFLDECFLHHTLQEDSKIINYQLQLQLY